MTFFSFNFPLRENFFERRPSHTPPPTPTPHQFSNGPSLNNARKDMTQHKDEPEVGEPITGPSLSCSENEIYRMF